MTDDRQTAVTRILQETAERDDAIHELLPLVYDQLRSIARHRMAAERDDHTLQATALVHEAYVKLVGRADIQWQGRGQFFAAAAEAMRRLLIDHARKHRSEKRGGNLRRIPLSVANLSQTENAEEMLALEEALEILETEDDRAAQVVKLRFFAGLHVDEVSDLLDLSPRTVAREWTFAKARLSELMASATIPPAPE